MSLAFHSLKDQTQNPAPIHRAILETLVYSDLFDYPLRLEEVHGYLSLPISQEELSAHLPACPRIESAWGYYFLHGRGELLDLRLTRGKKSSPAFARALRYGRIIGALPFVRFVALTGSLGMLNLSKNPDMDFFIVAKRGRVWLARAFILALNRGAKLFGDTLCPNIIVSETALEWKSRNLYTARELAQMLPISDHGIFSRLREINLWVKEFLPNTWQQSERYSDISAEFFFLQKFIEPLLSGNFGNKLEHWEMTRKINRFQKQTGYGAETQFNAEICQGNFDQHAAQTLTRYELALSVILNPDKGIDNA